MSHRIAALGLVLGALACNGPIVMLPGGQLEGEVAPTPEWTSLEDPYGTAQLETLPEDPYSVNLAYTVVDGRLYVNAGDTETRWVENMNADPRVRLRIDGRIYELRAERVRDPEEIAAFGQVWTSQSFFLRDPSQLDGEVWVDRLVAR